MFRLLVLIAFLLGLDSHPLKKPINHDEISSAIKTLQKQIQSLKDVVQTQRDAELKASPQKIPLKDAAKSPAQSKSTDMNEVNDLLADLEKAVQDDFEKIASKKKDALVKKEVKKTPVKAKDAVEVAEVKTEEDDDILGEMMKKEELAEQRKKDHVDMKRELVGIREDLRQTKDAFVEMEKLIDGSVTSSAAKKFIDVRNSLRDVVGALNNLKADVDAQREWTFHEYDEAVDKKHSLVKDIKVKLQQVADAMEDFQVLNMKDMKDMNMKDMKEKEKRETKQDMKKAADATRNIVKSKPEKKEVAQDKETKMETSDDDKVTNPEELEDAILHISSDLASTKDAFVEMKSNLDSIVRDHPTVGEGINKKHIDTIKKDMANMVGQLGNLEEMIQHKSKDAELKRRKSLLEQMKHDLKDATDNIHEVGKMAYTIKLHDQEKRKLDEEKEKDQQLSGKEKNTGAEAKREKTDKRDTTKKGELIYEETPAKVETDHNRVAKKDALKETVPNPKDAIWEDTPADETNAAEAEIMREEQDDAEKEKKEEIKSNMEEIRGQLRDVLDDMKKVKKELKDGDGTFPDDESVANDHLEGIKMKVYEIERLVKEMEV